MFNMLSMSYYREIKEQMLMKSYHATDVEGSSPMHKAECDPFPEDFEVEILAELARTVQYRVFKSTFIIQVSFKH